MSAREGVRRAVIWSLVAASLVASVAAFVVQGDLFVLAGWTAFAVMGALILTYRPGHNVGRVLLGIGVLWGACAGGLLIVGLSEGSGASWVLFGLSVAANLAGVLSYFLLLLVVLIFPSGRIESRAGRVIFGFLIVLAVFALVACALVPVPAPSEWSQPWMLYGLGGVADTDGYIINLSVPVFIAAEFVDLSFRWRRSSEAERFQYRWFAVGCAIVITLLIGDAVWQTLAPDSHLGAVGLEWVIILPMNAIPISIALAVLRYGLYDIRRVVSRAVAYTIVTGTSIVVYSVVVTSATWLLPGASSFAVAAATLAAAALFLPVLHGVQHRVDRRFDRERYDAERVVEAFGERLRTRLDPEGTADDLRRAVEKTLQPAAVGLWTRGDDR